MVQFKTDDIAYRKKKYTGFARDDWANRYWKLGFISYRGWTIKQLVGYLKDRGYECREKTSRPVVVDAIGRYQRGLMSYEGRNVDELRVFCKDRGLPAKVTSASRLARALENADDLATFPRFLDLPAEIRNIIYELHFYDFDPFRGQHAQPPLTLASRQLRLEALPLFYDCATFGLFATSHHPRKRGVIQPGHQYIALNSSDFTSMPAADFTRIKKFDLRWRSFSAREIEVKVAVRFTATSETENSNSKDVTLSNALEMGLESKFGTIENAREMLETGRQPLTMGISGDLFNTIQERNGQSGRHVSIGALALRTVKFD